MRRASFVLLGTFLTEFGVFALRTIGRFAILLTGVMGVTGTVGVKMVFRVIVKGAKAARVFVVMLLLAFTLASEGR